MLLKIVIPIQEKQNRQIKVEQEIVVSVKAYQRIADSENWILDLERKDLVSFGNGYISDAMAVLAKSLDKYALFVKFSPNGGMGRELLSQLTVSSVEVVTDFPRP